MAMAMTGALALDRFEDVIGKALRLAQSDQSVDQRLTRLGQELDVGKLQLSIGLRRVAHLVVTFLHHTSIRSWNKDENCI